jgi:hypothetical protein
MKYIFILYYVTPEITTWCFQYSSIILKHRHIMKQGYTVMYIVTTLVMMWGLDFKVDVFASRATTENYNKSSTVITA